MNLFLFLIIFFRMVPPLLPRPICMLDPMEIEELPFIFNECLRPSRRRNGYHVFSLLFKLQFFELGREVQQDLLRPICPRSRSSSISSSSSSLSSSSSSLRNQHIEKKHVRLLGNQRWKNLPIESKMAWKHRSFRLNQRPPHNGFDDIQVSLTTHNNIENPLRKHIIISLSNEWNNLVKSFRSSIVRKKKRKEEVMSKTYKFGNETILLSSQIYRTFTLTHLLRVFLFGDDYSMLHHYEFVERTKESVIIHIASYDRLIGLLSKGAMSCCCHFKNADEYDYVWCCSSKVWLEKEGKECIGYVMSEAHDELTVMVECDSALLITFQRPYYSVHEKHGEYKISSDVSTSHPQYVLKEYWLVRIRIMKKSGNCSFMFNRIKMKFEGYNDDLNHNNILIRSRFVTKVITPIVD